MRLMITPRKKIADTGRKSGSWGSYRICWPFWSSEKLEVGQLAVSLSSRSRKDFQGSRAPTNCLIRWVSTSRSPPDVLREMGLVPFSRQGLLFGTFNRMVVKHRYSCFKPLDCELGVTTTKVDLNSSRLPPVKTSSSEVLNVCVCVCVCVCVLFFFVGLFKSFQPDPIFAGRKSLGCSNGSCLTLPETNIFAPENGW